MPLVKLRAHSGQLALHLTLLERERTANDRLDAVGLRGNKGPDDHAGTLGQKRYLMTKD